MTSVLYFFNLETSNANKMYRITKKPMNRGSFEVWEFKAKNKAVNFFLQLCGEMCYPINDQYNYLEAGGSGYDYHLILEVL